METSPSSAVTTREERIRGYVCAIFLPPAVGIVLILVGKTIGAYLIFIHLFSPWILMGLSLIVSILIARGFYETARRTRGVNLVKVVL
eukprot:scaffold2047_cov135-Skeletonema_menzelii.AAC.2